MDWTNQDVTVTLSATDTGTPTTGVASTKYSLDGGPYQTYSAPFNVSTQGLHTLLYQSQDLQGNVESPAKSFTIKIDKTKPVITLNGAAGMTVVYGGGPFTDSGATATDAGGSGLNGPVSTSGSINTSAVGDYTLSYDVSDKAGNAADTVTRTVHVVKADQSIDLGPLADKTYGDPDFDLSATAGSGDPVVFNAAGDCTVSGNTVHLNGAGSCTITADEDGNANYNAAPSVQQSFNILKAPTTTAVTCPAGPFTYNGLAQTPCSAVVTGAGGLNQSLAVSYLNNINAGTATAGASYAVSANYLASSDSKNFQIDKANATLNVTGYTGVYDGSAHGATGTATGVLGVDLSSLLNLGATFTNVPGGTANWTFNSANTNPNYNAASGSVSIVNKAWTLRGFYSPVAMSPGTVVVWNNNKGGQTVPLKFNLYAGTTEKTSTSDVRGFSVTLVPCTVGLDVADDPSGTLSTTGGTAFRYSGTSGLDGQFIQNWTTPSTSGKCYKVTMTALDYSTISAFFKTK